MGAVMKLSEANKIAATSADLLQWQGELRAAAINSITPSDMREIVERQVERAKSGDDKALRFLLQLLGTNQRVTINNNFLPKRAKRLP